MKDFLQRFIFENAPVRGEFIHLDATFLTIIAQHNYPEPLKRLLGEALCVAGLLTALIKFEGRLTVQFRGKGALKLLLAQCDNHFGMRAVAQWEGELSYQSLMASFEEGVLSIMVGAQDSPNRHQGIVSWRGQSLIESIEGYFKDSEQLMTKIWLNVNQNAAAGVLLQALPLDQNMTDFDLGISHWQRITQSLNQLTPNDLLMKPFLDLLKTYCPEDDIRAFQPVPVEFSCTCSRKKGSDAILVLGKTEAEAELKRKKVIVVTCDFCNSVYQFDRNDIAGLFGGKIPPDTSIH